MAYLFVACVNLDFYVKRHQNVSVHAIHIHFMIKIIIYVITIILFIIITIIITF